MEKGKPLGTLDEVSEALKAMAGIGGVSTEEACRGANGGWSGEDELLRELQWCHRLLNFITGLAVFNIILWMVILGISLF